MWIVKLAQLRGPPFPGPYSYAILFSLKCHKTNPLHFKP